MHSINISERLIRIASYLPEGANFADIGSDHAYLPSYVCRYDHNAFAIAGEVNEGPYSRAKDTIHTYGLKNQVEVRLGDGLHVLQMNEVKQVVISGMGGALIREILYNGMSKLHKTERIIVQPNTGARHIRKFLVENNYAITNEELIEENGQVYEIIIADKNNHINPLGEKNFYSVRYY